MKTKHTSTPSPSTLTPLDSLPPKETSNHTSLPPSRLAQLRSHTSYLVVGAIIVTLALVSLLAIKLSTGSNVNQTKRSDITQSTSGTTTTINMIGQWKGEDKRENYIVDTIKAFEIQNPTIKVNLKWNKDFPGGRAGALKATSDQILANKIVWDIIWMEPLNYQPVADSLHDQGWAQKDLVDFEQVPGFAASQKPFIVSDPQYRNHFNGMLTGPYIEGFYQPLFYNKTVADKLGLSIPLHHMTYDEFLGDVKAVYAYNQQHGTHYSALYESQQPPTGNAGDTGGETVWALFQSLFRSQIGDLPTIENLDPSPAKYAAVQKVLGSLQELSQYHP